MFWNSFNFNFVTTFQLFFRADLLKEAIQFEAWSFLRFHFPEHEWIQAKTRAEHIKEELQSARETSLKKTKIFRLSRAYPAFNEDSLPPVKLDGVIDQ